MWRVYYMAMRQILISITDQISVLLYFFHKLYVNKFLHVLNKTTFFYIQIYKIYTREVRFNWSKLREEDI